MTFTLTWPGQITLPQEVRSHLGVSEGDQLEIILAEDGSVRLVPIRGSIRRLSGLLRREGAPPQSLAELDQAIMEVVTRDDDRIRARKG